jgi:hypothetical protein
MSWNMIEIGDKFVINWKGIKKTYPKVLVCKFPDLEFTVDSFSKSMISVYYLDMRTNKKCYCQYCCIDDITGTKKYSISVNDIIITQKKLVLERDRKLKSLGI